MVINYKKMNEATEGDANYLHTKNELIENIRGMKYFSTLDCKSGFLQLRIDEESKPFSSPQGHYEWNVLSLV